MFVSICVYQKIKLNTYFFLFWGFFAQIGGFHKAIMLHLPLFKTVFPYLSQIKRVTLPMNPPLHTECAELNLTESIGEGKKILDGGHLTVEGVFPHCFQFYSSRKCSGQRVIHEQQYNFMKFIHEYSMLLKWPTFIVRTSRHVMMPVSFVTPKDSSRHSKAHLSTIGSTPPI